MDLRCSSTSPQQLHCNLPQLLPPDSFGSLQFVVLLHQKRLKHRLLHIHYSQRLLAEIVGKQVQTAVLTPATITLDLPVLLIEEVIRGSSKGFTVVRSIISWSLKRSASSGKRGPNMPSDIVVVTTIGKPRILEARARPTDVLSEILRFGVSGTGNQTNLMVDEQQYRVSSS